MNLAAKKSHGRGLNMSRYNRRPMGINNNELYEKHLEDRDVSYVEQYVTPEFIYPNDKQENIISYFTHPWSLRDKYYILAHRYYNDPKLWWIIAQYNQAPTERHLIEGELIKIPYPLSAVYSYLGQK